MTFALLVPHADDETLFASTFITRYSPDIFVCYLPRPDDEHAVRWGEMRDALLDFRGHDRGLDWLGGYEGEQLYSLEQRLTEWHPPANPLDRQPNVRYYDHLFAPHPYPDGHAEHNAVGETALRIYGPGHVTLYHTYGRQQGRVRSGNEVHLSAQEVVNKLRALSRYRSQIDHPVRRAWFTSMLDLTEWYG